MLFGVFYIRIFPMKFVPYYRRTINYYIRKSFLENPGIDLWKIADSIIKDFKDLYVTDSDVKLFDIILKKEVSQSEFEDFIKLWDIEEEGGDKALFLSYFMKTHPDLVYPEYIEPRLKGILQYYRFKNLKLVSGFIKICNRLKEEKIDIMIVKGGAVKHYRPDFPRIMNDIDILVRNQKDYERCKEIVKDLGYSYMQCPHSIDLHNENGVPGLLDIHYKFDMIPKDDGSLYEDIFERAHIDKVFNVDGIYVPCCEDMMFINLINLAKNLIRRTSYGSKFHSAFDCTYFAECKPDFDWNIVIQNAKKTHTENQIYIAIKYLNEVLSAEIPVIFEKEFKRSSINYLYNKLFLAKLAKKSDKLKLKDIFKNGNKFLKYIRLKPQYFIYKRKIFRKNFRLAKCVLERQKIIV